MSRASANEGLLATLPAQLPEALGAGPDWLVGLRREAAEAVREHGFPGKKHEGWRFTSVREVVHAELAPVEGDLAAARGFVDAHIGEDETFRLVLANGRPERVEGAPEGVSIRSLAEVLRESPSSVEGVLGALAGRAHFAGLNAAMFEDGVVVEIARNARVERPIHIVEVATGAGAAHPRVIVIAHEGSQATLIESYLDAGARDEAGAAHLTNAVTEVDVRANARLDHARVTEGSSRAMQIAQLAVRLERDASYASRVVSLGGKLGRLDVGVRFEGPGAEATLEGVYHVAGADHVDHQLRVAHAAGHCTSHVRYRGLLDGRGHAVFNAMGIVERGAQQSNAHQENRNLLLSGDARVDTKPHLEIDANDIAASHGTTVGALDAAQEFYLRARGLPAAEARNLLTFAFVQALLDGIPHEPLRRRMGEAVLERLPGGDRIKEVMG